ncbi:DUF4350 domain-containing protein [Streptomyces sp. NBC_00102]|uniref:DUF4350 domain-containing protein n=1 Tax=Streptomyces sp. NBC_00102 TaxID=2975652 RepID=UPI00224E8D33|nr:DUF4350 domain-containing protein [Streptomyces sp. NBC_00102]MCX5397392.1 DUF4350 domain-containing protein [Streptomyces sp. NBC_00102]
MTGPTQTATGSADTAIVSGSAVTDTRSAPADTEPPSTSLSATPDQIWKRVRGLLAAVLVLVVGGVTIAALQSGSPHGTLDPRSADPDGSRALAELLGQRGVTVDRVTTLDAALSGAGADSTLLVTEPDLLTGFQQERLFDAGYRSGGRTVLIAPEASSVPTLAPGVSIGPTVKTAVREPACSYPAARRAGAADLGGVTYEAEGAGVSGCYPAHGLTPLLVVPQQNGETVLLGNSDILVNEHLAHEGNASLALQLLGSRTHLVWYLPSLSDPSATEDGDDTKDSAGAGRKHQTDDEGAQDQGAADGPAQNHPTGGDSEQDRRSEGGSGEDDGNGFLDLIPSGWLWGTLQLAVAAALAAAWRGRRFGPLVAEKLPVAVHASEATEGHARLYRKAGARDRAATLLRESARIRLAPLAGVSPRDAHSPDVLVPALSARLPADGTLDALLFGPTPDDDTALVRLADQLDALEREVRTS